MRIEIRDASESRLEVAPLVASVYPPEVFAAAVWRNVVSARATQRVLVYDGETLVSAVGVLYRKVSVDGAPSQIAGIGGVMTLPCAQRKGYGRAAMEAAHSIIASDNTSAFGLLFCEPKNFGFYGRLGWSAFGGTVIAEQPNANGPYRVMPSLVKPFVGAAPGGGLVDLQGLPW